MIIRKKKVNYKNEKGKERQRKSNMRETKRKVLVKIIILRVFQVF